MVAVAGQLGHVPKRSDQRRRQNKDEVGIETAPAAEVVEVPEADLEWHPAAVRWYRALADSGQSHWYEPSDWAQAWVWAEFLHRALMQGERPSAVLIAAWSSGAAELLTTEGSRRRMRIELAKAKVDPDADAAVTALDDFRARFQA